jgi:hypothetical protein
MGQISDDIFLGPVWAPNPLDPNAPSSPMNGLGPMGRVYVFDIKPVALNATGLATAQAATGGPVTLTAGTGVTTRVDAQGRTRYVLDVPRAVTLTAAGANTQVPTVTGWDQYGQPMTQTTAAPSTSTVTTTKCFKEILSITYPATPGSNVSAGTADVFGFPFVISDVCYIVSAKWATTLADNAGTVVVADATSPATAATGDVRGTYATTSASNGTRRLVCCLAATGLQVGPNATRLAALGVTQV